MTKRKTRKGLADAGAPETAPGAGDVFPVLLDEDAAAEVLSVSPTTLQKWRISKPPVGPSFVRMGKAVRYRLPDLLEYVDAKIVRVDVAKGSA